MSLMSPIRRFVYDRRGNFLMIFGLLLVPLVGILGISVDYALMNRAKTQLDATNDAAVLAAATAASQTIQSETTTTSNQTQVNADAVAAAKLAYGQFFASDSARSRDTSLNYTTTNGGSNPSVTIKGLLVTVSGVYTAKSPNMFGQLFGVTANSVAGTATASVTLPNYVNIYIVADVSQSEGLAVDTASETRLAALTQNKEDASPQGCQFGCHVITQDGVHNYPGPDFEDIAHAATPSINLRIDAIRNAIIDVINQAQQSPAGFNGTPRVQLAIYTMDSSLTQLVSLSSNYSSMLTTVTPPSPPTNMGKIDLSSDLSHVYPNKPTNYYNGSSYQPGLLSLNGSGSLASTLPANGDGSSPNAPINYVFLMTDGVYDTIDANDNPNAGPGGTACGAEAWEHCTGPFTAADCSAFKGKATVDVIYTQYLQNFGEPRYQTLVQPYQNPSDTTVNGVLYDGVQNGLTACAGASDPGGQVILATDENSIEQAAISLFDQVVLKERLTE
jgi:Flp pilus assembly protein TadG